MELYIITIVVSSADLRSCVKVEMAALSSPSLLSLMVSVVVKRLLKK